MYGCPRLSAHFWTCLVAPPPRSVHLPWNVIRWSGMMEWNGGMDYWSGTLDWTTGVPRLQIGCILGHANNTESFQGLH